MIRPVLGLAASLLMLTGCVQPQVSFPKTQSQQIVGAAQNWNQIASSVARQLATAFPPDDRRVYLAKPDRQDGPFYRAFTMQLTTEFIKQGVAVSSDEHERYSATIDVVQIRHAEGPRVPLVPAIVGAAAGLTLPVTYPPRTEIIVTTQIARGPLTVAASTGSFYIYPSEIAEYRMPDDAAAKAPSMEPIAMVAAR